MFTGTLRFSILRREEVTFEMVEVINAFLKREHGRAHLFDIVRLRASLREYVMATAMDGDGVLVGFASLALLPFPTHTIASIQHLSVRKGFDFRATAIQLNKILLEHTKHWVYDYVDARAWEHETEKQEILLALGFKVREKLTFRLRNRVKRPSLDSSPSGTNPA